MAANTAQGQVIANTEAQATVNPPTIAPEPPNPDLPANPEAIRVRITNHKYPNHDPITGYGVTIKVFSSHPGEDDNAVRGMVIQAVLPFLPSEHRKLAAKYAGSDVPYVVHHSRNTIPFKVWANAIAQALINQRVNAKEADVTTTALHHSAYMAIGDTIYQLQPIGLVKATKALVPLRKRIIDAADAKALKIESDAQAAARTVITKANDLKKELEKQKAALKYVPPEWSITAGYPMRFDPTTGRWEFLINFLYAPKALHIHWSELKTVINPSTQTSHSVEKHYRRIWPTKTGVRPIPCMLWLPINSDNSYSVTACHMDSSQLLELPHVRFTDACMSPGSHFKYITSRDNLYEVVNSIVTTLNGGIQLDSLLVSTEAWDQQIRAFLPDELTAFFVAHQWRFAYIKPHLREATTTPSFPIEEYDLSAEHDEEWHV